MGRTRNALHSYHAFDYSVAKQLYEDGWSLAEIADELGVSRQAIHYALRKLGTQMRPKSPGGSQRPRVYARRFDHEEAKVLYESGWSMGKIAKHYGVHLNSVSEAFTRLGVTRRPQSTRTFDYEEAKRLYRAGLTQDEIAKRFGVKQSTISVAIRDKKKKRRPSDA